MLSEEQIKRLVSLNKSLQVQLEEANAIIGARNKEVEFLRTGLAETTALRSKMDGQQDEIENFQYLLYKKEQQAAGAADRETGLQLELTEFGRLNNTYEELLQDHALLNNRFADAQARLAVLNERNLALEQVAGRIGELESILENSKIECEALQSRLLQLESQKDVREFNSYRSKN